MNSNNPVAVKFSQAATTYKQHDVLQRITAEKLLSKATLSGDVIDIGCGPGTDFTAYGQDITKVTAVDLSEQMLAIVNQSFPSYLTLCADAANLPLSQQQFDGLYSNLVLQWCGDLTAVFNEFHRVVKPKATCFISIVTSGSLLELETLGLGHNAFRTVEQITAAIDSQYWQVDSVNECSESLYFNDLRTMLYSIKGVGASVKSHQENSHSCCSDKSGSNKSRSHTNRTGLEKVSLRGRKDWLALKQHAETMRQAEGIPLTYQITYLQITKK
ncbi:methyltransferase domain-containing protein [Shewanella sp. 10N.7]|uniref:methyltransferase domain-containing protein n=1 Tax=Shewanella sp. 10N.7 TaxID=2885093 RepID=UPI001E34B8A6|nr:methyltransferase domain-containing protein [Shewanella sp. 10N.7]MCC4831451.1 methyltransferase domain-containing protein [Shewanella sp. 10N.7]